MLLVVISGPLCAGKTTLARSLEHQMDAHVLLVRDVIQRLTSSGGSRADLLEAGGLLERQTEGTWLRDAVEPILDEISPRDSLVIDSIRTLAQFSSLRRVSLPSAFIHLTADHEVRRERFESRSGLAGELDFDSATSHETEQGADELRSHADLCIDTTEVPAGLVTEMAMLYTSRTPGP